MISLLSYLVAHSTVVASDGPKSLDLMGSYSGATGHVLLFGTHQISVEFGGHHPSPRHQGPAI